MQRSETTYLRLKKHDNVATNENEFDIDNYLNGNWDKINSFAQSLVNILFASSNYFSESTSYAVGDYTIYNNKLYKCTTEHTGAWNAAHFEQSTIFVS